MYLFEESTVLLEQNNQIQNTMILLENGFKGYLRTYRPNLVDLGLYSYPVECTCIEISPKKKKRPDNRKYAYIYTRKGCILVTVDTKTGKAYKLEAGYKKTWKPIRKFIFGYWV